MSKKKSKKLKKAAKRLTSHNGAKAFENGAVMKVAFDGTVGPVTDQRSQSQSESVANVIPVTMGSEALVRSAATLRMHRQQRYNPLRNLSPLMLTRVLDQFAYGEMREAVMLFEKMMERDDTLPSVIAKCESEVAELSRQVSPVTAGDDSDEAQAHAETLEDFWANARAVNSFDRNERGGWHMLLEQMMSAVSLKYSAHHIIWDVRRDGSLRATFEHVPLWLFENKTGSLRYLATSGASEGVPLVAGDWMITTGRGLMIPCSIGFMAKRGAWNDTLIFSEKFSVPGVMGRTSAKQGSPEGDAMRDAVSNFGHDWVGLIYNDDGSVTKPIEIIQASNTTGTMPMEWIIDTVNEKFITMYRGGDLSTKSSGEQAEGRGASLQGGETDLLKGRNARRIEESLEQVSRMVIEWTYGQGTEPLAKVELVTQDAADDCKLVAEALQLAEVGAKVSISEVAKRRNIPLADKEDEGDVMRVQSPESRGQNPEDGAGADGVGGAGQRPAVPVTESVENTADVSPNQARFRAALSEDLRPLGDEMWRAHQLGEGEEFFEELVKLSERVPELVPDAEELSEVFARTLVEAWVEAEAREGERLSVGKN